MGSPSSKTSTHAPAYDPTMQQYLDGLQGSLATTSGTPDRISGESLYNSINSDISSIADLQNQYSQLGTVQGVQNAQSLASQYSDPRVIAQIEQSNQDLLNSTLMGNTASQLSAGNANGSRAALAEAAAIQNQSQQMNADLLAYETENLNRAQSDIAASLTGQSSLIGAATEQQQYLRELLQGDENASWAEQLFADNPDLMRALLYSGVANTSPLGTVTQTTSGGGLF